MRHHEQGFQVAGRQRRARGARALTTLTLVLPNFTTTTPGPMFSPSQLVFVGVVSLVLYGAFVFVQTVRHRDYFLLPGDGDEDAHAPPPPSNVALVSLGLLLASLVAVVCSRRLLHADVERGIDDAGAPKAVVGIVIAAWCCCPKGWPPPRGRAREPAADQPQPRAGLGARQHRADHPRGAVVVDHDRRALELGLGAEGAGAARAHALLGVDDARHRPHDRAAGRRAPGHLRGVPVLRPRAVADAWTNTRRRRPMVTRRSLLALVLPVTAMAFGMPPPAQAKYPERPILLLLAYAAGGGTDTVARVFASRLGEKLGGSIVVENRPGAGGNIATDAAAAARPDGYTLLIGSQGPMVVNMHLFKSMRTDPEKALEPIILIADVGMVVVVNPKKHDFKTFKELVDELKRRPNELTYGSASNASASHLAALLLEHVTQTKARHVPYRGAGPAIGDLVGGHLDFMISSTPSVLGQIEGGVLRALAISSETRASQLPNVPTAVEGGVPGYVSSAWYGLMAPKGLPPDVKETLETAAIEVLKNPAVAAKISEDGATPSGMRSDAFRAFMAKERAAWGEVVKAAGLTISN